MLPESASRDARDILLSAERQLVRLAEEHGVELVGGPTNAVVQAIHKALEELCGDALSEDDVSTVSTCSVPLRASLEEATEICAEIRSLSEEIDSLLDRLRGEVPEDAMSAVISALSPVLGYLYIEFLRPLRHQHPTLEVESHE